MSAEAVAPFTVCTRAGCHLCDDMIAGPRGLQAARVFERLVVDVDCDPVLRARYGQRLPVVFGGGRELRHYFLVRAAVTAFLGQIR